MLKKLLPEDLNKVAGGMIIQPHDLGFDIELEDLDYNIIDSVYQECKKKIRRKFDLYDILRRLYEIGYARDWDLKVIGKKNWDSKNMEYETQRALYNALREQIYSNRR